MPKGQTPKMHCSIVNIPVNVSETCNHLQQEGHCEEVIFCRQVYSEPVPLQRVRAALEFLQKVNLLYQGVLISDMKIDPDLLSFGKKSFESKIDFEIESDDELETTSNPLNTHRHAADKSLVIVNENFLELAPGQIRVQDVFFLIQNVKDWLFQKHFLEGSLAIHFHVNII